MSDACVSDACGCTTSTPAENTHGARYQFWDNALILPILSGLLLVLGVITEGRVPGTVHQLFFWVSLVAGGITFVPDALKRLVLPGRRLRQRLSIGLLMTISAIGAVLLGYTAEAAALAFLFSIAETLEDRAFAQARSSLRSLYELIPSTTTVRRGAETVEITSADIVPGDVIVLRAGDAAPTDGNVSRGTSSLDTAAITGESLPRDVAEGDEVHAGSINLAAPIEITATSPGTDNSITTIVRLVEDAQNKQGERARLADRIARPLIPGVLVLSLLVGVIGSFLGDPATWITRALIVLVAASPCAIAIAVPVTVISAIGAATRWGVIITSGSAFERLGAVDRLAFDKTGTLTANRPTVTTVIGDPDTVALAASVEQHSLHPLAQAIVAAHEGPLLETRNIVETPGQGIKAEVIDSAGQSRTITIQSPRSCTFLQEEWAHTTHDLEQTGATVVVVAEDDAVKGLVGIGDPARESSARAIEELHAMGIRTAMLTGDNKHAGKALATTVGIDEVHAELLPEDKAQFVDGRWAMVGDGINDAPALAAATVGIAMGATGTDAAMASADVALTGTDLRLLPRAMAHARAARRIMNVNIGLALAIIVALPPLALSGVLGLAEVVFIHEVAEVAIIANGLRAGLRPRSQMLL